MDDCMNLDIGDPKAIRIQAEQGLRALIDPNHPEPPSDLEGWDPQ
jgi:hypothetical protein